MSCAQEAGSTDSELALRSVHYIAVWTFSVQRTFKLLALQQLFAVAPSSIPCRRRPSIAARADGCRDTRPRPYPQHTFFLPIVASPCPCTPGWCCSLPSRLCLGPKRLRVQVHSAFALLHLCLPLPLSCFSFCRAFCEWIQNPPARDQTKAASSQREQQRQEQEEQAGTALSRPSQPPPPEPQNPGPAGQPSANPQPQPASEAALFFALPRLTITTALHNCLP